MANVIHFDQGKTVSEEVEYVVVGAGLPRTGTLSTMTALELLLPGRCHHMTRTFSSLPDHEFWHQASQGQLKDQDWREFIKARKLSASVDFPMSLYWRDLARLYPQAKVILTVRDPVKWYQSVMNTIRQFEIIVKYSMLGAPLRLINFLRGDKSSVASSFTSSAPTYLGPKYPAGTAGALNSGQDTAVSFFNDWNELVKREIPGDRLLVFQVKEGWGPLCQFLGVPEPKEEFPHVNDTLEMQGKISGVKRFCYFLWAVGLATAGVAGYFIQDHLNMETLCSLFCIKS